MESNKPDGPETLQVVRINLTTGREFLFQAPVSFYDPTDTPEMGIPQFVLFALRRLIQTDTERFKSEAEMVLPIIYTTVDEISIEVDRPKTTGEITYTFPYQLKDSPSTYVIGSQGGFSSDQDGVEIFEQFIHGLVKECFGTEVVQFILATYVNMHRAKLLADLKPKKDRKQKKLGSEDKKPFRMSGHLMDQRLKYQRPDDSALAIFDSLRQETQEKIKKVSVEHDTVVEGIRLTPGEQEVVDSLCKMLHEKSETYDANDPSYYAGNQEAALEKYGTDNRKEIAPKLSFTLYELTKEFKGGEAPSGKDITNVANILKELEPKRFLIAYTEKTYKKDGGRTERKIEEFQTLIRLLKYSESNYTSTNVLTKQSEEVVIILNPIFRHQIDSKFILYPYDLNRRTIIAYGSHNIADSTFRFRDYLLREKSYSRAKPEINLENLYWLLCEKWMKEKRRKKVTEYVDRAIETVKRLGLLLEHEVITGSDGQRKAIFHLDLKWE